MKMPLTVYRGALLSGIVAVDQNEDAIGREAIVRKANYMHEEIARLRGEIRRLTGAPEFSKGSEAK